MCKALSAKGRRQAKVSITRIALGKRWTHEIDSDTAAFPVLTLNNHVALAVERTTQLFNPQLRAPRPRALEEADSEPT